MSMSNAKLIGSVSLFQNSQTKYYVVNGYRYHDRVPIGWALDHKQLKINSKQEYTIGSGPENCSKCRQNYFTRGIFIGYCETCIYNYLHNGEWRGNIYDVSDVGHLSDSNMWKTYPYMMGIRQVDIIDNVCDDTETFNKHISISLEAIQYASSAKKYFSDELMPLTPKTGFYDGYEDTTPLKLEDLVDETIQVRRQSFEDTEEQDNELLCKKHSKPNLKINNH